MSTRRAWRLGPGSARPSLLDAHLMRTRVCMASTLLWLDGAGSGGPGRLHSPCSRGQAGARNRGHQGPASSPDLHVGLTSEPSAVPHSMVGAGVEQETSLLSISPLTPPREGSHPPFYALGASCKSSTHERARQRADPSVHSPQSPRNPSETSEGMRMYVGTGVYLREGGGLVSGLRTGERRE